MSRLKFSAIPLTLALTAALTAGRPHAQGTKPAPEPFPGGKHGGVLQAVTRENPPSLSPHESTTISALWPILPVYNNLVLYDPFLQTEDSTHLIGELAERWDWSEGGRRLTFKLRRGVQWHDGKPFTAADVKHTLDIAREAPTKQFKINPRKEWWANIKEVATNGDYEVSLILDRPQPALLSFLATGYAPIYPAHIDVQDLRSRAVGTGPFRLKEYKIDERIVLERNPAYFVKNRPYLDGIVYTVIRSRPSRMAALQAGQVQVGFPNDGTVAARDQVKGKVPDMVVHQVGTGVQENILLNLTKPPFNNPKLALAVNLALDRSAGLLSVHQGSGVLGGALTPPPLGRWGLTQKDLQILPGYGDPARNKLAARKLLEEAGYGPRNPLQVTVTTRDVENSIDVASWVIAQLKEVGIEGVLKQIESGIYGPKLQRRDFELVSHLTAVGTDDPDANLFENYFCQSARNFTGYCNADVDRLIVQQSSEADPAKRMDLVKEIDRRLQRDSARPILLHRVDYFMHWPQVKNLVPHHSIYSYGRMQEVWLDR